MTRTFQAAERRILENQPNKKKNYLGDRGIHAWPNAAATYRRTYRKSIFRVSTTMCYEYKSRASGFHLPRTIRIAPTTKTVPCVAGNPFAANGSRLVIVRALVKPGRTTRGKIVPRSCGGHWKRAHPRVRRRRRGQPVCWEDDRRAPVKRQRRVAQRAQPVWSPLSTRLFLSRGRV